MPCERAHERALGLRSGRGLSHCAACASMKYICYHLYKRSEHGGNFGKTNYFLTYGGIGGQFLSIYRVNYITYRQKQ